MHLAVTDHDTVRGRLAANRPASGERFWVSASDGLQPVELRIAGTRLATGARIKLVPQPAPGHQYDLARLGDGRFVRLMGELFLIDPPNPERKLLELPAGVTSAALVAANGQRIWLARPGELVAGEPLAVVARAPLPSPQHRVHALAASAITWPRSRDRPRASVARLQSRVDGRRLRCQRQVGLSPAAPLAAGAQRYPRRVGRDLVRPVWELATLKTLLDRAP
jgi:hypothetical protein